MQYQGILMWKSLVKLNKMYLTSKWLITYILQFWTAIEKLLYTAM